MGTNYYLHLGKVTSQGADQPKLFTEAVDVDALDASARTSGWVMDEYGHDIPWSEFMELHRQCQRTEHHGENFS